MMIPFPFERGGRVPGREGLMAALDRVMSLLPEAVRKAFDDPDVSELMINGPGEYFVERGADGPVRVEAPDLTAEDIYAAAIHIARPLGLDAGEEDAHRRRPAGRRLARGHRAPPGCPARRHHHPAGSAAASSAPRT